MPDPLNPLPTVEQQFLSQFYEPAMKDPNLRSIPDRYAKACEQYEQQHGHQCPLSLPKFKRVFYAVK